MYRSPNDPPKPFKQLTKRKREFIKHYVRSGDAYEAYEKAGYKMNKSAAYNLHRELSPYYPQAMKDYLEGVDMGILGAKVIKELAVAGKNETVRLNAAKELLVRSAPEDPKETTVNHVHKTLTNDDVDKRIKELQDKLFIDAPKAEVVSIGSK